MAAEPSRVPRLVIGGVSSGVGKTTVTVGLARALQGMGLRVALFKCGPDYLDPTYHARAVGRPSHNLDGWMMGREAVRATFLEGSRGADLALIEGVMGLFDGASPTSDEGSTAEIAKWLEAPVALVVDAGGMARSVAAILDGFASFDPGLRVAGLIANRVGTRAHGELLREALVGRVLFGALVRDREHAFAERHLGLHTASTESVPEDLLDQWAARAAESLDLDALLEVARSAPALPAATHPLVEGQPSRAAAGTPRARIGVAQDEAFHFYYVDNLRRLEALGAELVPFSPLGDRRLPEVDGLYLGGGYPEQHAAALEANRELRREVVEFARCGGPIYAECGGLMYLTEAIRTLDGSVHEMVGLLPGAARMHGKLQALGYVEVETVVPTLLGPAGTRLRGHQFRYSELAPEPPPGAVGRAYRVQRRRGGAAFAEGYHAGSVLASYVHAHWASSPSAAAALVDACVRFAAERARGA